MARLLHFINASVKGNIIVEYRSKHAIKICVQKNIPKFYYVINMFFTCMMARISDPVWYWPDLDPDPTSNSDLDLDLDPNTSFLKISIAAFLIFWRSIVIIFLLINNLKSPFCTLFFSWSFETRSGPRKLWKPDPDLNPNLGKNTRTDQIRICILFWIQNPDYG